MWVEDLLDAACEGKSSGQIPEPDCNQERKQEVMSISSMGNASHSCTGYKQKKPEVIGIQTPFLICF